MIRINLLKDVGGGGTVVGGTRSQTIVAGLTSIADFGSSDSGARSVLIKIILLILPIGGWYGMDFYLTAQAQEKMVVVKNQVAEMDKKLKEIEPVVKELERFQEEKRKLDSQVAVIKRLAKERLRNVKSLDALQGIIPLKAWLNELKVTENKVSLVGFAADDSVVSEFMKELESSIYFAGVTLKASEESKTNDGVVKKFEILCNLENL
jgi:hypothetical protein